MANDLLTIRIVGVNYDPEGRPVLVDATDPTCKDIGILFDLVMLADRLLVGKEWYRLSAGLGRNYTKQFWKPAERNFILHGHLEKLGLAFMRSAASG